MKKSLKPIIICSVLMLLLSGCAQFSAKADPANILTINYGTRNVENFIEGITAQFPDIHFEINPVYSCNASEYLRQTLITGNSSDIFYYTQKASDDDAKENLIDLSGYDFINNYDRAMINTYTVNGRVYQIPGPAALRGMIYNKTLFAEHGWKKPENHQELVELCKQIRIECDDITPIAVSLGAVGYPFTLVTTFSQAGFLGTPDGEVWEEEFLKGEASIKDGWGEGLEMLAELIDAGAFNPEPYVGVWDSDALNIEFSQGKAAMFIMLGGQTAVLDMAGKSEYEFEMFPFYGMEDGEVVICAAPAATWGISKRLEKPGNEKKLENALRVMEWLSTPEAQELMKSTTIGADGNDIYSTAEVIPLNNVSPELGASSYFKELWRLADKGHKMPMVYSGYEPIMVSAGTILQNAMLAGSSDGMIEKFIDTVDSEYKMSLEDEKSLGIGEVRETLSYEETAQLLANAMNESGIADFAMLTKTGRAGKGIYNRQGSAVNLFEGHITNHSISTALGEIKNVQVLMLKGSDVKEMLKNGKRVVSTYDESYYYDYPYYWSGIDVSMNADGSAGSVKLHGEELEDDGEYRVLFCNGDYTDEIAKRGNPTDTNTMITDIWLQYIESMSPISKPEVLRK